MSSGAPAGVSYERQSYGLLVPWAFASFRIQKYMYASTDQVVRDKATSSVRQFDGTTFAAKNRGLLQIDKSALKVLALLPHTLSGTLSWHILSVQAGPVRYG
jgi:hypothetical protein